MGNAQGLAINHVAATTRVSIGGVLRIRRSKRHYRCVIVRLSGHRKRHAALKSLPPLLPEVN